DTARGPVVIGAVSRGVNNAATPCGGGGIYVRTDKIVQWIEQTVGKPVAKDACANVTGEDPDDGSGTDPGTGTGDGTEEGDDFAYGAVSGGCSVGGSPATSGVSLAFLALGMMFAGRRRRRGALAAKP